MSLGPFEVLTVGDPDSLKDAVDCLALESLAVRDTNQPAIRMRPDRLTNPPLLLTAFVLIQKQARCTIHRSTYFNGNLAILPAVSSTTLSLPFHRFGHPTDLTKRQSTLPQRPTACGAIYGTDTCSDTYYSIFDPKGTDRQVQLDNLQRVLRVGQTPYQKIKGLLALISSRFKSVSPAAG
ncbi:uncharacterized protein EV422DRAFT_569513 [Fimicolochytrium jonesii]|uniref:uncharacterized protein n=1 Tax=Fimicolochytrium jonesii TaxID=1396493 RepID=UPI0022FDB789|nr:uncharacterized protein EV422DRAFT_569513 [Fimicolochytrium jonesii]KAI8818463.1 hypothetical protein EV422DRAFT_569513 [Fimicolochytrium jonesii]